MGSGQRTRRGTLIQDVSDDGEQTPRGRPEVETSRLGAADASSSVADSLDLAARLALDGVLGRLLGQRRGLRLGRYEIAGVVGRGACGEVFRAHDAELDREVAIKVLLPARTHRDDGPERQRLLDEARALARLRHPNVVEVFDVGVGVVGHHADGSGQHGVYVVMQWLPGDTLAAWAGTQPPWRAMVEAWCQVATGLQAAHDAGLVHGDVKPHNAIIERIIDRSGDGSGATVGRVRVVDFGLARDAVVPRAMWSTLDGNSGASSATTVAGTPLYMAPEQHRGEMSPAADQFALSVSLWQALAGAPPFRGGSMDELAIAKQTTRPKRPRGTPVPAAIWAVLERGLAPDPSLRFRDLRAWIDAIGRARRPGTRRAGVALALASIGALAGVAAMGRSAPHPCDAAGLAIEALWDGTRRESVHATLAALDHPDAAALATSAVGILDDRAAQWTAAWSEMCAAPAGGSTAQVHACLTEEYAAFDRAIARAAATVPGDLGRLESAVAGPKGTPCAGVGIHSEAENAEIRALEAEALRIDDEEAFVPGADPAWVDALVARADALGRPDLAASMQFDAGDALLGQRSIEPGIERMRDAVWRANAAGLPSVALDMMPRIVFGYVLMGAFDEADRVVALARQHAALHGSDARQDAALDMVAGLSVGLSGDYEAAERLYQRACDRLIAEPDPTSRVSVCIDQLVTLALNYGDVAKAARQLEVGLAAAQRVRRTSPAMFAAFDAATASVALHRGHFDAAIDSAARCVERSRADTTSAHTLMYATGQLAMMQAAAARTDEAIASYDQTLALARTLGHPPLEEIAHWHVARMWLLLQAGRLDEIGGAAAAFLADTTGDPAVVEGWYPEVRLLSVWSAWATGAIDDARRELDRLDASLSAEREEDGVRRFAARMRALLDDAGDPVAVAEFGAAIRRNAEHDRARAEQGDRGSPTEAALDAFAYAVLAATLADPDVPRRGPTAVTGSLRAMYVTHARALAMLRHAAYPQNIHRF